MRNARAVLAALALTVALHAVLGAQAPPTIADVVQAATGAEEMLTPLQALGPLGISPFLALGLFGLAAFTGHLTLPGMLGPLSHPALWASLIGLALLLKLGRSSKLTKPFAELAGTSESLVSVLVLAGMTLMPALAAPPPGGAVQQAGVFGTMLMVTAGLSGLLALILVRTGLDLLAWLSPVPLVDAALQLVKLVLTALLVAVAVFFPALAIALNLAVLVAAALLVRWMLRVGRFGVVLLRDCVVGRFRPAPVYVGESFVGPVPAFMASGARGLPRWSSVHLWWTPAGWMAARRYQPGQDGVHLGFGAESRLARSFAATTLTTPRVRVLITAAYHPAVEEMARRTGTEYQHRGWRPAPALSARTI